MIVLHTFLSRFLSKLYHLLSFISCFQSFVVTLTLYTIRTRTLWVTFHISLVQPLIQIDLLAKLGIQYDFKVFHLLLAFLNTPL